MSSEDAILINDLRCLRMRLGPLLTTKYKNILIKAENRINGEVSTSPATLKKKPRKTLTTAELKIKFNSKGL